ncbi:MAG: hypothetical protein HYZ68_07045 [Chloroflexi bacterium]|nr:hypothetical protein [Chloroflexota bacterium]
MTRLAGAKLLLTSGPTRGNLDAVRYITNKSTGRLGALIAEAALAEGAEVTFIYGTGSLTPHVADGRRARLRLIEVETVSDLIAAVRDAMGGTLFDAVIHAMAVLDYEPAESIPEKVPSEREEWVIRLVRTPKVIRLIRDLDPNAFLVGFKLEVGRSPEELRRIGFESLQKNRADLVIANDLAEIEKGRHRGHFIDPRGEVIAVAEGKPTIVAQLIEILSREYAQRRVVAEGGTHGQA